METKHHLAQEHGSVDVERTEKKKAQCEVRRKESENARLNEETSTFR